MTDTVPVACPKCFHLCWPWQSLCQKCGAELPGGGTVARRATPEGGSLKELHDRVTALEEVRAQFMTTKFGEVSVSDGVKTFRFSINPGTYMLVHLVESSKAATKIDNDPFRKLLDSTGDALGMTGIYRFDSIPGVASERMRQIGALKHRVTELEAELARLRPVVEAARELGFIQYGHARHCTCEDCAQTCAALRVALEAAR